MAQSKCIVKIDILYNTSNIKFELHLQNIVALRDIYDVVAIYDCLNLTAFNFS